MRKIPRLGDRFNVDNEKAGYKNDGTARLRRGAQK
jgi:hypothetical protein